MSEEKKDEKDIQTMIKEALASALSGQNQPAITPMSVSGWGGASTKRMDFEKVMASLQGVIVELRPEALKGNVNVFWLFPPEFGNSPETLNALLETLYEKVPVNTWGKSGGGKDGWKK